MSAEPEVREVEVRRQSGESVGRAPLEPSVFAAQINVPVMHQVVRAQLAAARAGTHATKTRGEVSGGGKKPYRQKGTGRARQGSIRAPHYTGGGTVFGPQPRSHSINVPKKMKAQALRSALSDRAREGRIAVVEAFEFERPSTKQAVELLRMIGAEGSVLVVLDDRDEAVAKSFRNLPEAHVLTADQLNTYDVLRAEWVIFSRASLEGVNTARAAKATRRSAAAAAAEPATTEPATEPAATTAPAATETAAAAEPATTEPATEPAATTETATSVPAEPTASPADEGSPS